MTDTMIIEALGFLAGIIAVAAPIIRLTGTIDKLGVSVEMLEKTVEKQGSDADKRLTVHGHAIDELEKTTTRHEVRIGNLEEHIKHE